MGRAGKDGGIPCSKYSPVKVSAIEGVLVVMYKLYPTNWGSRLVLKYFNIYSGLGFRSKFSTSKVKSFFTLLVEGSTAKICGTDTGTKNTNGATGVSVLVPQ